MLKYDYSFIDTQAKKAGFVRDMFEKTYRLVDILEFIKDDALLSQVLVLKGGTAINLTVFNLPRLSVDIDLDYSAEVTREQMLKNRSVITDRIDKYLTANGYTQSNKTKRSHALDSFIYEYKNVAGMTDNLKIEINYVLRCHVLSPEDRLVLFEGKDNNFKIKTVSPIELFASKIVALLSRSAPRDLYDVYNMVKSDLFNESETDFLRRCVVFYSAVNADDSSFNLSFNRIKNITQHQILKSLLPVLRKGEFFNVQIATEVVEDYFSSNLRLTDNDKMFLDAFNEQVYRPDLLFGNTEISKRLERHPMALWKSKH